MKGAFETFLVLIFGLTFFVLGISIFYLNYNFHQARIFQESIVSLIERQSRLDENVLKLIDKNHCQKCNYNIIDENNRFQVQVSFPIEIPILKLSHEITVSAYTYKIKQLE